MGVQDAVLLFTEPNVRFGAELGAKGVTILGIVINVIFLGLVFYKILLQQISFQTCYKTLRVAA